MDLVWLKQTVHTHNTAWAKSRQLISQTEDKIALLNQTKHLQEELAHSIENKKGQMQKLAARIAALQTTRQTLMSEIDMLQRANAALNMLPAPF